MNLGLYMQGAGLGLAAAAPIGPVNVEIIRRGLTRGYMAAMALGLGACTADMIYLSLVLGGMAHWAQGPIVKACMLLVGGVFLLLLGVLTILAARKAVHRTLQAQLAAGKRAAADIGTSGKSFLTGLAMTLTNPMTIAYWVTVSARLSGGQFAWGNYLLSLAGVATGTIGWVIFISLLSSAGQRWVTPRMLLAVNLLGGALLVGFGIYFCLLGSGLA